MGITATFLKSRVKTPTLGKWASNFAAVKKAALAAKVPLIAVWSNGDACGHCQRFTKSISQTVFKKWQAGSGCHFWFGCRSDKTAADKFEGTGFKFARNGQLTTFPFVRVYWKPGKVDACASGGAWTGDTAKGGARFVDNLKMFLEKYNPKKEA